MVSTAMSAAGSQPSVRSAWQPQCEESQGLGIFDKSIIDLTSIDYYVFTSIDFYALTSIDYYASRARWTSIDYYPSSH